VFLWLLGSIAARLELACHAYCLMGTHYHLLVECRREELSLAMHRLNGRYARHFNERHSRSGHVFGDRYSAYIIKDEAHLEQTCDYIAANPVKAGLCDRIEEWPWTWLGSSASRTVPVPAVPAA
jgi:putative transposase